MINRLTYLPTQPDPYIHSFGCVTAHNNEPKTKEPTLISFEILM